MPEGFFRYVAPARVAAYIAIGWQVIGSTRSPHDAQRVAIMEWPAADEPIEPDEDCIKFKFQRAQACGRRLPDRRRGVAR